MHDILHIVLLLAQIVIICQFYTIANTIQSQNYEIQKALYDFEPQISGFVNGIIWVYEYKYEATANIEILINAPHSGNFTLMISKFYPTSENLDPEKLYLNHFELKENVRDVTYPQAYKFKGDIKLYAHIYPKSDMPENIVYFNAGVLEFEIVYYDVAENKMYIQLFNGTVWFEFSEFS